MGTESAQSANLATLLDRALWHRQYLSRIGQQPDRSVPRSLLSRQVPLTRQSYAVLTFHSTGVVECGLFPGCVYVFSLYYPRHLRHFRVSLFFSGAALAG